MERRLSELRNFFRGWMGYFGLASQLKLFDEFDQWIRRRFRMCYWKQRRRPKRRREVLIRLGTSSDTSRSQPPELLAHGHDHCQWGGTDQCVTCRTRTTQREDLMGRARSISSHRPVRTRMLGGVGARQQRWPLSDFRAL